MLNGYVGIKIHASNVSEYAIAHFLDTNYYSGACSHGDVRLSGGPSNREGHVELCITGTWTSVCDDAWDSGEANVVCRQLGFNHTGTAAACVVIIVVAIQLHQMFPSVLVLLSCWPLLSRWRGLHWGRTRRGCGGLFTTFLKVFVY